MRVKEDCRTSPTSVCAHACRPSIGTRARQMYLQTLSSMCVRVVRKSGVGLSANEGRRGMWSFERRGGRRPGGERRQQSLAELAVRTSQHGVTMPIFRVCVMYGHDLREHGWCTSLHKGVCGVTIAWTSKMQAARSEQLVSLACWSPCKTLCSRLLVVHLFGNPSCAAGMPLRQWTRP
jgi:hypothetical protein